MYKHLIYVLLFYSTQAQALIDNIVLVQVANNTLESIRELKDIVSGQREFATEFERVHAQVNTRIWQAQRAEMWVEDMQSVGEVNITNLDDFNLVLRSIKSSRKELQQLLVEAYNKKERQKAETTQVKKEGKRADKRLKTYASGTNGTLNTTSAQIQTAQNTHDMLMEQTRTNKKLIKLLEKQSALLTHYEDTEARRVAQQLRTKDSLGQLDRGILKQEDFE